MFPQGDGRVHTTESNVSAVVFTGTGGVHFLIRTGGPELGGGPGSFQIQSLKASRIACCFWAARVVSLAFNTRRSLPSASLYGVVDTDIPQVQAVLQNLVGIGTAGSVGGIGCHIVLAYRAFAGDLPLQRVKEE